MRSVLPLVLCLAGCSFVSEKQFFEYRAALDQDGDGSPFAEDCDDNDPTRSPIQPEVPYDRLDQDCDGLDLIDRDGDGSPGVSRAEWEANPPGTPALEWPLDFVDVDCDDDPATGSLIFPGAQDVPYDGVDQNCDLAHEFDLDGDGYTAAGFTPGPEWETALGGGDCNDFFASAFPGASDVPGDGHDTNCDGSNDFDVDGDGFTVNVSAADYDAFCTLYPAGCVPSAPTDPSDCNDADALEFPGSPNPDLDCQNDSDGDGFEDCAVAAAPCDCNDADPLEFPGAPETLDGIDEDCGNDGDQSPWHFTSYAWDDATPPAVASAGAGFTVAVAAEWNGLGGGISDPAMVITFPSAYAASSDGRIALNTDPGEAMEVVASSSATFATTLSTSGNTAILDLAEVDPSLGSILTENFVQPAPAAIDPVVSVDAVLSGGTLSVLYCRGGMATIRQRSATSDVAENFLVPGDTCVWDASGPEPVAHLCSTAGCTAMNVDGSAAASRWPTLDVTSGRHREGVWIFTLASGGALLEDAGGTNLLLGGTPVLSADVTSLGGGEVAVAAVVDDGTPHVVLLWGNPGALNQLELAPDPAGRLPVSVGLAESNGVIGVFTVFDSVTPQADGLAWIWLAL